MAQATFSVRMDEGLKKQFDRLCAEFGMNTSTAINIFAKTVVRERRIPFEIAAPEVPVSREEGRNAFLALREQAAQSDYADLSLEEINTEIRESRQARKQARV